MHRSNLEFFAVAAACLAVAVGCSSNADDDGSAEVGQCPTSISGAQGANNAFAAFNGYLSGDYGGPDGFAKYSTICLRLADVPQTLAITVMGAKPAAGATYNVTPGDGDVMGDLAIVEYAEGNNGTKVWAGTSGTVKVDSVARESIGLSFTQVVMAPEPGKSANTASGDFSLSGSQRADDVLGFVP